MTEGDRVSTRHWNRDIGADIPHGDKDQVIKARLWLPIAIDGTLLMVVNFAQADSRSRHAQGADAGFWSVIRFTELCLTSV